MVALIVSLIFMFSLFILFLLNSPNHSLSPKKTNFCYTYKYLLYQSPTTMIVEPRRTNEKQIPIKLIDVLSKQHKVEISNQLTGYQLKEYLYSHLCKELKVNEMKLTYEGEELNNNVRLMEFIVAIGNVLTFRQDRISLDKVSKILVAHIEDPIYCEEYTYQWPCGHYIGQAGISAHIKAIISNHESVIRCPFELENGSKCGFEWDYSVCKKIGVFTAQEKKYFENALSENYAKQHLKGCPKCHQSFMNESNSNRVRCPNFNCKYGDFCYRCMGTWQELKSTYFCGSQTCKFAHEYLITAPWDRIFQVKDPKTNEIIKVRTPIFRGCPTCNMVIENYISCKHTDCTKCKTKFCWICLSVYNNKWECGSYSAYCGKVAQVQKFMMNQG